VPELLIEVGFEEMPAPWLKELGVQLAAKFAEIAGREFLEPTGAQAFWTPRRLVLRASILGRQPDREEPVWGPSLKVAKDASGKWTGAAQGFAKKNGVSVESLQEGVKDPAKPEERYLVFARKTPGRPAGEILPGVIAATMRGLSFPKRMSWDAWLDDGKGAFPFGRPIRWLMLLLDGTVVPLVIYETVAGAKGRALVTGGPATFGHRFLPKGAAGRPIGPIRSFEDLQRRLEEALVLLDPADRRARIDAGLKSLVGGDLVGGLPVDPYGLREEWRDLVEYPTVVAGNIPAEFRALPREVLETVLVHHQKYLPFPGADGTVTRFAAVTNTDGSSGEAIVRGMERVVVARLRDASFFYAEDLKRPLADRVTDLAGVTFHQRLGTYKDKAERLVRLVEPMGELGLLDSAQRTDAVEAARLAKCDLTTLMVREFPELQGIVGGIYLRAQGAPEGVATAVGWHYHPPGGAPRTPLPAQHRRVFAAVSLADKLDTLAGYFGLGLNPTGSSDPFALRRAAQGVIRVVLEFWKPANGEARPNLAKLVELAVRGYSMPLKSSAADIASALEAFLLERLDYVMRTWGFPGDEVEAVTTAPAPSALADPLDALERVQALHRVRAQSPEDFAHLAAAFKRAKNILAQQQAASAIEPGLFEAEAERELHRAVQARAAADGDYDSWLRSLAGLRAPVDRFFDEVLVMAEDARVRGNRLALLAETLSLFYRIADVSKLGG